MSEGDAERVDLGIVVALRDDFRELRAMGGEFVQHPSDKLTSYRFKYGDYEIVAAFVGDTGQAQAGRVAERLIDVWRPESIVSMGFAAGVHEDLRVGDVYVPTQADEYIQGAKAIANPQDPSAFVLVPGGPARRTDYKLIDAVRNLEFGHAAIYERFVDACVDNLKQLVPDADKRQRLSEQNLIRPRVALVAEGHVATGPVDETTEAFSTWIRSHDRNVKALETDTAGVYSSAQEHGKVTRALAIRGISDAGDSTLRKYAMRNAVRFLWALLEAKVLPRSHPSPSRPPKDPPRIDYESRLPATNREVFGRKKELEWLDACWKEGVRVASIVAFGGVGKSALVKRWLQTMDERDWDGAENVYGWSFYRQGVSGGGSSDEFFAEALQWFGDTEPAPKTPREKGLRLANLVRKQRTLLILDGLEPLQEPPENREAKIQDPALREFVRALAQANPGLCVLTTRTNISDLKSFSRQKARTLELTHLEPEAGAELLRSREAKGTEKNLREASEEYKGHALALTLLGNYVRKAYLGDIGKRTGIPWLDKDPADRMMAMYERWFADKPESSITQLLGLFDGPAAKKEIDALRAEPTIAGLTDRLVGLGEADWNMAVTNLRDAGLVADVGADESLDAHPLVRAYFAKQVRDGQPEAFREGHRRLYEFLRTDTKEFPETLAEMKPLYAAVVHGCLAGKNEDALVEVYWERIKRGDEHFSTQKLGAFGGEASMLRAFFDPPWERLAPGLTDPAQAFVLSSAGFTLRALGRVREATQLMRLGLDWWIAQDSWKQAAIGAGNLSELLQSQGDVRRAVEAAQQSVALADKSEDAVQRMGNRTTLAHALHVSGQIDEAAQVFEEAERMQKDQQPRYPLLYSLRGFQYCDLLLDQGETADVRERAIYALEVAVRNRWLLDIALDHLSLGRAHLLGMQRGTGGDLHEAATHLDDAVEGMRDAGQQDYLPLGLLARATLHIHNGAFDNARIDLDEALELAESCGFRLHEADAHLGHTRLALAQGKPKEAAEHLEKARKIVKATGYGRRYAEVSELDEAVRKR